MRFAALVKKELTEASPAILTIAILLMLIGALIIHSEQNYQNEWDFGKFKAGEPQGRHTFMKWYPLHRAGPLIIVFSIALAAGLGAGQFMEPFYRRNWAYTIHRSVKRTTILWAKFTAAAISMVIGVGLIWTMLYLYACQPGKFPFPPSPRVLLDGWLFILMSMVVYFAMVLTAVSTTQWYTTRVFPLVFTGLVYVIALSRQTPLSFAVIALIASAGFCLQIVHTFTNREF